MRLDEFMTGAADVHAGIVEDRVFEMDKFAFGPQRGTSLSKIGPRDKPVAEGADAQAFIEPRQAVVRGRQRRDELGEGGGAELEQVWTVGAVCGGAIGLPERL